MDHADQIIRAFVYFLRKLSLDPPPLVPGLVISPTFALSLRQSLIMSNGSWTIFFPRPPSCCS
jgi:putative tricarboxylic transport membrane protein